MANVVLSVLLLIPPFPSVFYGRGVDPLWKEDRARNICRDIVIVVVECQLEESRGLLIKRGNLGVGGFSGWFFERCGTMEVFDDRYPGQGENL